MSEPATSYTVTVPQHKAGGRLDRALADLLPQLSRSRLKALIAAGAVTATGGPGDGTTDNITHGITLATDPALKVCPGQVFRVAVPAVESPLPEPQAMPLVVVYEDDDLIVIDKPAGLVVHPAPGNRDRTLVNALLAHCGDSLSGIGGVARPGIVHRLDKDTSGLLVAAKNDAAHRGLAAQFAEHSVERAYRAVVWGLPRQPKGTITGNIGRNPANRKKMAIVSRGGKPAITHYAVERVLGKGEVQGRGKGKAGSKKATASVVECRLETGRTHQIRVHLASLGHPVIGDPLYGGRRPKAAHFNRQALHAYLLGFNHPLTGMPLRFKSNISNDIIMLIDFLEEI